MLGAPVLIWKEIRFRPLTSSLCVLTVTAAVGLVVLFLTTAQSAERETRRIQRDLGFNLRIISAQTDPEQFWLHGHSTQLLSQELLDRLTKQESVSINHLVGILQLPFVIGEKKILLTGITASINTPGHAEGRMRSVIEKGTLELGHEAARQLGRGKGESLTLRGRSFKVARVLLEKGTREDLCVFGNLADVQAILELPGKVNEIRAIDCLCLRPADQPLEQLRRELEPLLPEARILLDHERAAARAQQRHMIESTMGVLIPCVVIAAAICIAALMMSNARNRRQEIGLLRALGRSTTSILILFLGKALALGLAGGIFGAALGTLLAVTWGPEIFQLTAASVRPMPWLIGSAVALAPLLTMAASLVPAAIVATLEPAAALRED